jgi:hypothetical protein
MQEKVRKIDKLIRELWIISGVFLFRLKLSHFFWYFRFFIVLLHGKM